MGQQIPKINNKLNIKTKHFPIRSGIVPSSFFYLLKAVEIIKRLSTPIARIKNGTTLILFFLVLKPLQKLMKD